MMRPIMVGIVVVVFVTAALPAQEAASIRATSALAGVVRDTNGVPIANVAVTVLGQADPALSDSLGQFHVSRIPAGTHTVSIMRLGYVPLAFEAALGPDSTVVLSIRLRPVQTLSTVAVSARRSAELARVGFFERMDKARGTFITPERIDSMSFATRTSTYLRDVRGIVIKCSPVGRGGSCDVYLRSAPFCLWLFIDGIFVATDVVFSIDDAISAAGVRAIEVYDRPMLVPMEFQGRMPMKRGSQLSTSAGCGALVVWTKARGG